MKVSDPLVISPQTFLLTGPSGGPFLPGSVGVTLTNASAGTLNWGVNNTSTWFNVSPAGGSLPSGAQTSVPFNLTAASTNLQDGFYSSVFQVTNLTSQVVQMATGMISVGIVVNGGFETGDFTGWTLVDDGYVDGLPFDAVVNAGTQAFLTGSFVHSGSYGVFLGDTNLAYISQTIQTTLGQKYLLSFWLDNPVATAPQQFLVDWNTNKASTNQIYFLNNPSVLPWTKVAFVLGATDTNPTLVFGALNPVNAFGLDDISVTPFSRRPSPRSRPT